MVGLWKKETFLKEAAMGVTLGPVILLMMVLPSSQYFQYIPFGMALLFVSSSFLVLPSVLGSQDVEGLSTFEKIALFVMIMAMFMFMVGIFSLDSQQVLGNHDLEFVLISGSAYALLTQYLPLFIFKSLFGKGSNEDVDSKKATQEYVTNLIVGVMKGYSLLSLFVAYAWIKSPLTDNIALTVSVIACLLHFAFTMYKSSLRCAVLSKKHHD